jgi:hypothetical protein
VNTLLFPCRVVIGPQIVALLPMPSRSKYRDHLATAYPISHQLIWQARRTSCRDLVSVDERRLQIVDMQSWVLQARSSLVWDDACIASSGVVLIIER